MIAIKRAASLLFLRSQVCVPKYNFSGDKWKDRDEAAEKVFISQQ